MSPARMAEMARYFRNGKTDLELVQTYASDDIAVLVMVERQTAEVGGLPNQDWSLRITEVYRKAGAGWELVHRHADPLVKTCRARSGGGTRAWTGNGRMTDSVLEL